MTVAVLFLWNSTSNDRGKLSKKRASKVQKSGSLRVSGNVDAAFMERIQKLMKIVIPDWSCKESKYILILTLLLVLRTQMTIWLADVNGKIVKAIIERNLSKFIYRVSSI